MKRLLILFFLCTATFVHADGIDRITIYVNDKQIADTKDQKKEIKLKLDSADLIKIHLWTDWGGEFMDYTIDVLSDSGEKISTIKGNVDKRPGLSYLIIGKEHLNKNLTFVLNYEKKTKLDPWTFIKITPN